MCEQALHALHPIYAAQPNKSGAPLTMLIGRLYTCWAAYGIYAGTLPQAHTAYAAVNCSRDDPIAAAYCLGF
ncbi:MAG: hypothetical protein R2911_26325 [Caldilineaceae bacterium]